MKLSTTHQNYLLGALQNKYNHDYTKSDSVNLCVTRIIQKVSGKWKDLNKIRFVQSQLTVIDLALQEEYNSSYPEMDEFNIINRELRDELFPV